MVTAKILPAGVLLLIILSTLAGTAEGGGSGSPPVKPTPADLNQFTPAVVTPMFESMKVYGELRLKEKTKKKKGKTDQFILVLALSEAEILDVHNWSPARIQAFENEQDKIKRFAFLLNTADHDIDEYKGIKGRPCKTKNDQGEEIWGHSEHKLHGEVQFLERNMACMLQAFYKVFKDDPRAFPVFVMYSHYIPCAVISGTPYSCSEQLANVIKPGSNYQLLVAFTAYFQGTNAHKALSFMKNGAIVPFQKLFDGSYAAVYPPSSIDSEAPTFQGEVYQCLLDHPLSHCCTGDEQNRSKMVAFFVNLLTYSCTSDYKQQSGEMQDQSRSSNKKVLSTCMGKVIDENVKDDCEQCSKKNQQTSVATRDAIKFCVYRSLQVVRFFGQPKPQQAVFENSWVLYTGSWKDIYAQSPALTKDQRPKQVCGKWTNTVESLCTAAGSSTPATSNVRQQPRGFKLSSLLCKRPRSPLGVSKAGKRQSRG